MRILRVFSRIGGYYREQPWATGLGATFVVASALVALQAPRVVSRAVDALTAGEPLAIVWRQAALVVLIAVVSGVFLFAQRRLLVGVSRQIEHRLREELYKHLLRLPQSVFLNDRIGDLMTRATSDVSTVRMAVGPALMYAINTVTVMLVATTLMIRIHPTLTALALAVLPLVATSTRLLGTRMHVRWGHAQEELSRYTSRLQEHLVGLRVLRAYACEPTEAAALRDRNLAYVDASRRVINVSALFHPLLQALVGLSFVVVLGVGGNAVRTGTMTLGQFVEFNLYLVRLIWPMIAIGWVANLLQRGSASMGRIEELFAREELPAPSAPALSTEQSQPAALELRDVRFFYPGSARPAVADVTLKVRPGERVALVGQVASGKSTLLALIPRLLEPTRGSVLLDGRDVLDLTLDELRAQVALVPQGSFLFSATLAENIALGRPDAGAEQIRRAAIDAGLGDDLERLPEGLDTLVGERGVTLSGGQRQRVAIARALITRPRLLLLDDCLSAVDARTERLILAGLPDVSLVFATHRLVAAELCDRVYVLEQGQVIESGAPTELAARGGRYAGMVALQRLEAETGATG